MTPGRVVEALDVIEHVGLRLRSRAVDLLAHPLGLERGEKALHRGVIPDISGPAHRTGDPIVGQEPLELLACILAASKMAVSIVPTVIRLPFVWKYLR